MEVRDSGISSGHLYDTLPLQFSKTGYWDCTCFFPDCLGEVVMQTSLLFYP